MLAFDLEGDSRVIARPSGTEPKLKFYIEVREDVASIDSIQNPQMLANRRMDALANEIMALAGAI